MEAGPRDTGPSDEELNSDGPEDLEAGAEGETLPAPEEVEVELRPTPRLGFWRLTPIVGLTAVGSLMFAFPLAFEFGDGGAVVAMLGLLLCCCAAGWGMMAARRVGYVLPGLPRPGGERSPDWRVVLAYLVAVVAVVVLAVMRVARLR